MATQLKLVEEDRKTVDRQKALDAALAQIDRAFGKGSAMKLGQKETMQVEAISTGSLGLGGMLGVVAVATKHEFALVIIGGLFVMEALSVMMQVGWFKITKRLTGTGKRIFLMAPLHHHFQKKNWPETRVVARFWILSVLFALAGLATLKLR